MIAVDRSIALDGPLDSSGSLREAFVTLKVGPDEGTQFDVPLDVDLALTGWPPTE